MAKRLLVVVVVAIIAVVAAVTQAQQQQPRQPVDITRVKDNLHLVTGPGGNVLARVTPEGVILIDDKFEQDYAGITEKVRSVTPQPIKYVLNTHMHGDHTGGNAQFLKIAEVISTKMARDNMAKANQPGLARVTFTTETSVHLGGAEVRAIHMGRGHTNGDAVIYFPDLRVAHAGDLINTGGPFADYANGGSLAEWTATMDNILKLDFDTMIPGHGQVMTKADVQAYRDRINTLSTRVSQLVRDNVPKDQAAARLRVDDLAPWNLDNFKTRTLPPAYDEAAARR